MDRLERRRPLSEMLSEIAADRDPTYTIGEIIHRLGHRAFGAMLFVFSAPNWLPLPPGSSTILALPLVLLTPQLMFGVRGPWLPNVIDERPMKRKALADGFKKMIPWLQRIEKLSRPRLTFFFGPVGDRLIGLTCFLLSLVLLLPIPLGNMAPAAAIALFGIGMVQRDGVFAMLGYLATAISAGLLVVGGKAALFALDKLLASLGLA